LLIREFKMTDYPLVISLWKEAGLTISPTDNPESLKKMLEYNPDLFLIAQETDNIIGVVMGTFDGRRGWINHLAVKPDQQGTGIGSLLIEEVEKRFKAKGCEKVNLLIQRSNEKVQAFYEKQGYTSADVIFMGKWFK
jgi:ribosomal protein S18 acetylase RimI-like enzyme